MSSIALDHVGRDFGKFTALDDVSFRAEPGEVVALLGPNGAGKTTTIRLLNGVLTPTRGTCRVLDKDPTIDGNEVRKLTGVMTESAGLDDRLTARENVLVHARLRDMSEPQASKRTGELLERFGMGARMNDQVREFSTGQRKRVALACALIHNPPVLFLDEPTSGLDPQATQDVLGLLQSLARDHGRTVLLCTHFLGEASRLCQQMAVLEQGRLLAFGRPNDLAQKYWKDLQVTVTFADTNDTEKVEKLLIDLPTVTSCTVENTQAKLSVTDREVIPNLVSALVTQNVNIYEVVVHEPTMEDVYFAVTGRRNEVV